MAPVLILGLLVLALVIHLGLEWVWARRQVRQREIGRRK